MNAMTRFQAKVRIDPTMGCWLWTAAKDGQGYGNFKVWTHRSVLAHRWFYQEMRGTLPDDLVLHHLCGVRACVNPDHLVPLTVAGHARFDRRVMSPTCQKGHPRTPATVYRSPTTRKRECRVCNREAVRRYKARKRQGAEP
jgi:hypothetical protein